MKRTVVVVSALLLGIGLHAQAQTKSVDLGADRSLLSAGGGVGVTNPIVKPPPTGSLASVVIDLSSVDSWDFMGDAHNDWLFDATGGTGANLTALSWDITISTVSPSWFEEVVVYFDGSDQDALGLFLTPGVGDASSGTATYGSGGVVDLTDNGISDIPILADGLLWMEFHEINYDDHPDAIDAYLSGSITLYYDADCTGAVNSFGSACPGNGGISPVLTVSGCPQVGMAVDIALTNGEGGANWALILAASTGSIPLPSGCAIDLANPIQVVFMGPLPGAGAGGGALSFPVSPGISGQVFLQAAVKDSTTGWITSNGQDVTILP